MVHFRRDSLGDSMLSQFEMADLRRLLENAGRGIAFPPETGEAAEEPMRRLLSDTGMKKMVSFFRLLEILCAAPRFKILAGENREGVHQITDSRLTEV